MTTGATIDYEALQQDAARGIVRAALQQIVKTGLPGEHHFYISFLTGAPGVVLSKRLKEKYPHEMTIVLQHRFWDLLVSEDRFEVKLTFDGIPERLVIPFSALKVFIDPSVRFGLQFEDASTRRDLPAPRHALTMDAAYDAIGDIRPETPRATLARKPRQARKPKADKIAADDAQRAVDPQPPMPEQPSQAPAASTANAQSDEAAPAEPAGAKIVSLDAFRKK
ncbi:MAG: SspB family protein [Hyphomicrobium sp.]